MKEELDKNKNTKDRFQNLLSNYSELFHEIFEKEGLDYDKLQTTAFEEVKKIFNDLKEQKILDIGIGEGDTSKPFFEYGCKKITGIDSNKEVLEKVKSKFGDEMQLINADATNLNFISEGDFPIIISGMSIHNISTNQRILFWNEIKRLRPKILVLVEKITDENNIKYQNAYNKEVKAIDEILNKKYKNPNLAHEWIKHYQDDQKEALTIGEISSNLKNYYTVNIVFEMGLYKTVVCNRIEKEGNK